MELRNVRRAASPIAGDRVRLCCEVAYETLPVSPETYWFDVPEKVAGAGTGTGTAPGDPWLASLLPLAVTLGEPLRLGLPVDRTLYEGVHELMRWWEAWDPRSAPVRIEAEVTDGADRPVPDRVAAFFSAGVDSFFTALRHQDAARAPSGLVVDDLILVLGADVPVDDGESCRRLRSRVQAVASRLGKRAVDVWTNLRATQWRRTDWGGMSHGCALAGAALALDGGYRKVLIAGTGTYRRALDRAWGTHPVADPLLSTRTTRFVHDGSAYNRMDKLRHVAGSEVALGALRVCWESGTDANCGQCEKCLRTMVILELCGALERCRTLGDGRPLDVGRLAGLILPEPWMHRGWERTRQMALEVGRADVAAAIDRCVRRSRRLGRWVRVLGGRPYVWRWVAPLERWFRGA